MYSPDGQNIKYHFRKLIVRHEFEWIVSHYTYLGKLRDKNQFRYIDMCHIYKYIRAALHFIYLPSTNKIKLYIVVQGNTREETLNFPRRLWWVLSIHIIYPTPVLFWSWDNIIMCLKEKVFKFVRNNNTIYYYKTRMCKKWSHKVLLY